MNNNYDSNNQENNDSSQNDEWDYFIDLAKILFTPYPNKACRDKYNIGDTVIVRNAKIGTVVTRWNKTSYSIKLKDEEGKNYYETFHITELKPYE